MVEGATEIDMVVNLGKVLVGTGVMFLRISRR